MCEDCLVQDYYNFVNIPGEYRLEDCLLSKKTVWEGIVSPVVLHVRNAYKFKIKNGKRGYTQWKMPFNASAQRGAARAFPILQPRRIEKVLSGSQARVPLLS